MGPAASGDIASSTRRKQNRLRQGLRGFIVHSGQKRGDATGPNPTDRGKPGTKRHLITDSQGIPLAVRLTSANVHDSTMLAQMLDAVRRQMILDFGAF